MSGPNEPIDDGKSAATPGAIRDWRVKPLGVLPRHVQMWVMVVLALVILAIIWLTGQPQPITRPQAGARLATPALVPPDRVRGYRQQLDAEMARAEQQTATPTAPDNPSSTRSAARIAMSSAPSTASSGDAEQRRETQSLFADNVALSRRPKDQQSYAERRGEDPTAGRTISPARAINAPSAAELGLVQQLLRGGSVPAAPVLGATGTAETPATSPVPPGSDNRSAGPTTSPRLQSHPSEPTQRLLEGTVIETVLVNRLDGTFQGPVNCLVTTPVYSRDRQAILIPAGARVFGTAAPVQTWGDSRLAVSFHRLLMPDGRAFSLDHFKGLDQIGDTGLSDSVNRHYLQVFGASLAIGALSGLAQYGARSTDEAVTFGDSYRQAAGSSLAASTGRVLDRYLNVLPTITIREGYRIKVYLTGDLELPIYARTFGGE